MNQVSAKHHPSLCRTRLFVAGGMLAVLLLGGETLKLSSQELPIRQASSRRDGRGSAPGHLDNASQVIAFLLDAERISQLPLDTQGIDSAGHRRRLESERYLLLEAMSQGACLSDLGVRPASSRQRSLTLSPFLGNGGYRLPLTRYEQQVESQSLSTWVEPMELVEAAQQAADWFEQMAKAIGEGEQYVRVTEQFGPGLRNLRPTDVDSLAWDLAISLQTRHSHADNAELPTHWEAKTSVATLRAAQRLGPAFKATRSRPSGTFWKMLRKAL